MSWNAPVQAQLSHYAALTPADSGAVHRSRILNARTAAHGSPMLLAHRSLEIARTSIYGPLASARATKLLSTGAHGLPLCKPRTTSHDCSAGMTNASDYLRAEITHLYIHTTINSYMRPNTTSTPCLHFSFNLHEPREALSLNIRVLVMIVGGNTKYIVGFGGVTSGTAP